jgi:hypothetical protein
MARALPFHERGVCIDCSEKFSRDGVAWRCWGCDRALVATRTRAMNLVQRAIKGGELAPLASQACADCEQPATCYDHRDYSRPLDVQPVCRSCNQRRGPAVWAPRLAAEA